MDLEFILTALLVGALVYLPIKGLYEFLILFLKYRQLEIVQRIIEENVVLRIETVKHKEQEVQLVFINATGKFITQHTNPHELAGELVKIFKGKNVYVAKDGVAVQLFSKEETV